MIALAPECVQDYPRPPLIERVPQRVRALVGGTVLADTTEAWRVCETHHAPTYYLPRGDVATDLLTPSSQRSFCEWKGQARYYDLTVGDRPVPNAAWDYPEPSPRYAAIRAHLAIYAWAVDEAWVGDEKVQSQPGDFYGGWITANLTGRIKGAPGTEWW